MRQPLGIIQYVRNYKNFVRMKVIYLIVISKGMRACGVRIILVTDFIC
jgi:hypothetical protein